MEYKIKKEIDGNDLTFNLNADECRQIYNYVQKIYQLEDVEHSYDRETQNFNVTKSVRPSLIEQVVNKYNEMHRDAENGSWLDCIESAYSLELRKNHRGVLHIKENNEEHFFYGHYAGVESSSAVRFTKAYKDAMQNKTSIAEEIKQMKNSSGENLYLELKFDEAYEILNSFGKKNNIYGAMVTVDGDDKKYTYKSLIGRESYRVDTEDIVEIVNSISVETDKTKNIDEQFRDKRDILLKHTGKYNSAVLVEAGLPATEYYLQTDLYGLQDAVKGYIETLPQIDDDKFAVAFGNEEARLIEMQPNRKFGEDLRNAVCGPFIIVGDNGYGETVSLTIEQKHKYLKKFKKPDKFSDKEIEQALTVHFEFIELDNYYKPPKPNQRTQRI